jgi:hypothetical protein
MEPPLHGVPQFIVTSITFLITSNQAAYLNRLDEMIYNAKGHISPKTYWTWFWLLLAWWVLTGGALLGVIRILASVFWDEWFVFDGFILWVMAAGYGLLAYVAARSWRFSSWGCHKYKLKEAEHTK